MEDRLKERGKNGSTVNTKNIALFWKPVAVHSLEGTNSCDTRVGDLSKDRKHRESTIVELARLDTHPITVIRILDTRTDAEVISRLIIR